MLIYWKNLYVPCNKQCTGHREAQTHGTGQQSKNPPSIICIIMINNHTIDNSLFLNYKAPVKMNA
jgi:hypothetical protein